MTTWTPKSASAKDVKPGDIIQFRDVEMTTETKTIEKSGAGKIEMKKSSQRHHTAIVLSVNDDVIEILHQNTGTPGMSEKERKTVQKGTIWIASIKTMKESDGATIEIQQQFTKGTMWVYRAVR